jgi:hypothetical protein
VAQVRFARKLTPNFNLQRDIVVIVMSSQPLDLVDKSINSLESGQVKAQNIDNYFVIKHLDELRSFLNSFQL